MSINVLLSNIGFLTAGMAFLWLAGERVVRYTAELATALGVTKFFLGFIVLAIATGVPELAVAITASFTDVSQVSAGDVIGANFSNIALVVGLVLTVAGSITLKRSDHLKIINLLTLTGFAMVFVFALGSIGKITGFLLVLFYVIALFFVRRKKHGDDIWHEGAEAITHGIVSKKAIVLTSVVGIAVKLFLAIAIVLVCSWLTVHYAVALAFSFGAQLETVGATICALGTSLPELAMSLTALRRKEYELALAPTLGSVLEHSMLVLGVLGLCSRYPVSFALLRIEGLFMFAGFGLIILFLWRHRPLTRWQGISLLALYVSYLIYESGWVQL